MKVKKYIPEINKVYFIEKHTLIHVLSGTGGIQVDFNNYYDWQGKGIFLEKGQYIKFLSSNFTIRKYEFSNEETFYNPEVRVLFKHLISLGYINLEECNDCKLFTSQAIEASNVIDISSKQWYWQNPFKATKSEYQIIFDVKEIIDKEYANSLSNHDLVSLINNRGYDTQALVKNKVGLSVKKLLTSKKLIESKKEIAFTDKSIQEVAYQFGYKDDAYFNRVFKNTTGVTPKQFRSNFDFKNRDLFSQDIIALLQKYHMQERSLDFYAEKMNLSVKTLAKRVQEKMNASLGQLIRLELVNTAKLMLMEGENITNTSYHLGFEEPNHFSRFFKHYTGVTPTDFKISQE